MIPLLLAFWAGAADGQWERGMALAGQSRYEGARQAFLDGAREAPADKRFPVELAGLAYRREDSATAKRYLRAALRLDPGDAYANQFLGTLYFLDGNIPAALRYWNRIAKPRLGGVHFAPEPAQGALLLRRMVPISPGETLTLDAYRAAERQLRRSGLFEQSRLDLSAGPEGVFDATVRTMNRTSWWNPVALAGGLPYRTLNLDTALPGGSGLVLRNLLRWDPRNLRLFSEAALPLRRDPRWRYGAFTDLRRESWNLGQGDFTVETLAFGTRAERLVGASTEISMEAVATLRRIHDTRSSLDYRAALQHDLLFLPEHRLMVRADASGEVGRLTGGGSAYGKTEAGATATWLPAARGTDYETEWRFRVGSMTTAAPFDRFFVLGVDRDSGLLLRGHRTALDGRKGASPVGRGFVLLNWETGKNIWHQRWFTLSAGPFVDSGKIFQGLGPDRGRWLTDPGGQVKVRSFGWTIALSYGRNLHGGSGTWYLMATHQPTL